jgi:LCP family protein required for cell wall assembly
MNFKTKKIRKHIQREEPQKITPPEIKEKKLKITIPIFISIGIILILIVGIVKAVSHINLNVLLRAAGDELQKDEYGHTNFLLVGTGGINHEGADLTDTLIIAGFDAENKTVTMMSIPRDLYVKDEIIGNSRINETYYHAKKYYDDPVKGTEFLKNKIQEVTGLEIHYWAKINFQGFKDLIDALGGIDVYVDESIYDPYYPKDETFLYETFSISEGLNHMDGETALKYARSRKTTSDFSRAERQQKIIYAIKEKALQTETILSQQKLKNLLNALKANIETNIKIQEILTLGSYAGEFTQDDINRKLIHDDPSQCGGFVYPPNSEYYGGMFVLIPAGGNTAIQRYTDLHFNNALASKENSKLYVLNGTSEYGVAGETKQVLKRLCLDVAGHANSSTKTQETTYYYEQKYNEKNEPINSQPEIINYLTKYIPGKISTEIPKEYKTYLLEADVIIVLGTDYTSSPYYMKDDFYYIDSPMYSTNPFINTNNGTASATSETQ